MQDNWRWCSKCQGLYFADKHKRGICKAGGSHEMKGSSNYALVINQTGVPGQDNWRYCKECRGLFFGGRDDGKCPKDGGKHHKGESDYTIGIKTHGVDTVTQWEDTNWDRGWSHLVPFHNDGNIYLIAYNKNNGDVHFNRFKVETNGQDTNVIESEILHRDNLGQGWTHMIPFSENGTKKINYLVLYNNETGQVRFDRIKDDGKGTIRGNEGKWEAGWSQITAYEDTGDNFLLMYNNKTGVVCDYLIDHDGNRDEWEPLRDWATGWSQIKTGKVHNLLESNAFLVYNIDSGRTRLFLDILSYESPFEKILPAGFTHLECYGDSFITYNKNTGKAEINKIRTKLDQELHPPEPTVFHLNLAGTDIVYSRWWASGWSIIMWFEPNHYLIYNADTGRVIVERIERIIG
jgi:hypothetical protein